MERILRRTVEPTTTQAATDFDGAWKEALDRYLQPFLELAFPTIAASLDWSHPPVFLDTELQEVVREAAVGKQRADKLARVVTLAGQEEWLLIHLEVQSQADRELPLRMYRYHHRIEDRYGRPVVSVAVLADGRPEWRPEVYEQEVLGCRVRFEYPVCKLLDLKPKLAAWMGVRNPAAVVVAAHLATLESGADAAMRLDRRVEFTEGLYRHGFSWEEILELHRLMDWVMTLPEELTHAYREQVREIEERYAMPYITTTARLEREEGRNEGRQEGILLAARAAVLDVLQTRFEQVPVEIGETIHGLTSEAELKWLLREAARATSLAGFQLSMDTRDRISP